MTKPIHYQERRMSGEIADHYFTKEEFRKEFTSPTTGEPWDCHDEMLNNIGKWTDMGRVVSDASDILLGHKGKSFSGMGGYVCPITGEWRDFDAEDAK